VPIDPTETTATPTSRRSFLVRAALGGALVTVGTAAGPLSSILPAAAAPDQLQAAESLDNATFAALAIPLEMAAVQAYHAAILGGTLDDTWSSQALTFQDHHQTAVDTYTPLLDEGTTAPAPDPTIVKSTVDAIKAATTQDAILTSLADLENVLAATGLYAIGGLDDNTTAKSVAQIMAVESQQAVVIGLALDTPLAALTPAEASTDGAETGFTEAFDESTTTTTTAAAGGSTTTTEAAN